MSVTVVNSKDTQECRVVRVPTGGDYHLSLDSSLAPEFLASMTWPGGRPETYLRVGVALCRDEDGGYFAYVPVLPGCISQGETYVETLEHIKEALESLVEAYRSSGQRIPFLDRPRVADTPADFATVIVPLS